MVIEINLLPKKERKTMSTMITLILSGLILIIGSVYLFLSYQSAKSEIDFIKNDLQTTKQLRVIEEQKLTELTSTSGVDELKTMVDWVRKLPISTVTLLDHLTSLLPERGFILNISYADSGTVALSVQFDTNREVAYYLNELENSNAIESVQLKSMNTSGEALEKTDKILKDKLMKIIVPRYVAVYEIHLNRKGLKDIDKEEGEQ